MKKEELRLELEHTLHELDEAHRELAHRPTVFVPVVCTEDQMAQGLQHAVNLSARVGGGAVVLCGVTTLEQPLNIPKVTHETQETEG